MKLRLSIALSDNPRGARLNQIGQSERAYQRHGAGLGERHVRAGAAQSGHQLACGRRPPRRAVD